MVRKKLKKIISTRRAELDEKIEGLRKAHPTRAPMESWTGKDSLLRW